MSAEARHFPSLDPQNLNLTCNLDSQIYSLDAISTKDTACLLAWAKSQTMEGPKRPGKGEAERTSRRAALHSPEIASAITDLLRPHLQAIDPGLKGPYMCSPNIRVYHYPPGTFFRPHYDSPQLDQGSRRLSAWTVLIYLTEVKGGATRFHLDFADSVPPVHKGKKKPQSQGQGKEGKSKVGKGDKGQGKPQSLAVDPKSGRIMLHWHGVARGGCLRHEGEEVISGDKWILRTDVLG